MIKMINLRQIENDTKRFYDDCFELSLLQEQLEDMLTAIDENNIEFEKGNISRTAFKSNEKKLKKDSVRLIKNIKNLINTNLILLDNIEEDVQKQIDRKTQKRSKKNMKKVTEGVVKNGSNQKNKIESG